MGKRGWRMNRRRYGNGMGKKRLEDGLKEGWKYGWEKEAGG